MEEQILDILIKTYPNFANNGRVAKEITTHVLEFIEWLKDICDIRFDPSQGLYFWQHEHNYYTTQEVYQYWLENIKTK